MTYEVQKPAELESRIGNWVTANTLGSRVVVDFGAGDFNYIYAADAQKRIAIEIHKPLLSRNLIEPNLRQFSPLSGFTAPATRAPPHDRSPAIPPGYDDKLHPLRRPVCHATRRSVSPAVRQRIERASPTDDRSSTFAATHKVAVTAVG